LSHGDLLVASCCIIDPSNRLPVPDLLLRLASWLHRGLLVLLSTGHCGPRVAATLRHVVQHFQYPAGYRNYPPLPSALRCTSVGTRLLCLLRATCVLVWHFFYGKSRVETNWRMGVGPLPPRNLSSLSCIAFSVPHPSCYPC